MPEEKDKMVDEEVKAKEVESVLFSGMKKFEYPNLGTIWVKYPTLKENAEFSRLYNDIFTDLLQNSNLLTQKKMSDILKERGDWTDEDDLRLSQLQEIYLSKAVTIEEILSKDKLSKKDKEFIEQLEKERNTLYAEFINLSVSKNMFFANTIESVAENKVLFKKIVECSFDSNGEKKWNSVEEFENLKSLPEVDEFIADCVSFWRGESVPLSESSPAQMNGKKDTK